MFLESHFGSDAISPIERPKLPPTSTNGISNGTSTPSTSTDTDGKAAIDHGNDDEIDKVKALARLEAAELDRLHALGVVVPGLEIRVDKAVVRVWLETLDVECAVRSLADRVRAVVERAVETVAPLWG